MKHSVWCKRRPDGWSLGWHRPTLYGSTGRSVSGATTWEAIKFLIVPSRYYVWQYKRRLRKTST